MTHLATHAHLPALGEHERITNSNLLQDTLTELVDLGLTGRLRAELGSGDGR